MEVSRNTGYNNETYSPVVMLATTRFFLIQSILLVPRRDARALQIRPDFWSARIRLKTLRIAMMKI